MSEEINKLQERMAASMSPIERIMERKRKIEDVLSYIPKEHATKEAIAARSYLQGHADALDLTLWELWDIDRE